MFYSIFIEMLFKINSVKVKIYIQVLNIKNMERSEIILLEPLKYKKFKIIIFQLFKCFFVVVFYFFLNF